MPSQRELFELYTQKKNFMSQSMNLNKSKNFLIQSSFIKDYKPTNKYNDNSFANKKLLNEFSFKNKTESNLCNFNIKENNFLLKKNTLVSDSMPRNPTLKQNEIKIYQKERNINNG